MWKVTEGSVVAHRTIDLENVGVLYIYDRTKQVRPGVGSEWSHLEQRGWEVGRLEGDERS